MAKHLAHKRSDAKDGFILLAEDHDAMAELLIGMLRADGIKNEVVVARNCAETLEHLFCAGEHSGRDGTLLPSLVVLDVSMPRADGLVALRRIRADERTELMPVVMLSASDGGVRRAYGLGANGYVSKVSEVLPFHELVPLMVRYWLYANEAATGKEAFTDD